LGAAPLTAAQSLQEPGQLQQLPNTQRRAAGSHHDERISRVGIGPACRQAMNVAVLVEEEHAILPPRLAAEGKVELASRQGMERVRHPHPSLRTLPIASS